VDITCGAYIIKEEGSPEEKKKKKPFGDQEKRDRGRLVSRFYPGKKDYY